MRCSLPLFSRATAHSSRARPLPVGIAERVRGVLLSTRSQNSMVKCEFLTSAWDHVKWGTQWRMADVLGGGLFLEIAAAQPEVERKWNRDIARKESARGRGRWQTAVAGLRIRGFAI